MLLRVNEQLEEQQEIIKKQVEDLKKKGRNFSTKTKN